MEATSSPQAPARGLSRFLPRGDTLPAADWKLAVNALGDPIKFLPGAWAISARPYAKKTAGAGGCGHLIAALGSDAEQASGSRRERLENHIEP